MTSKRSKHWLSTLVVIAVGAASVAAKAADDKSTLPVVNHVGIIPVQWEKDDSWADLQKVRRSLDKDFYTTVRASNRFSPLNDDLVASLWATPAGRKELVNDYELQAFTSLDVASRSDMVVVTARLLSPSFDTWLQESDVIPRSWLLESSNEQSSKRLEDLIHRLINRLPVDVHVTSVNGEYVTLSGGESQSLHVGDQFDVVSAKIQTLHPANGSWLTFETSRTGKIKLVEVKRKSSIAKIVSLTYDDAIAVGQGIRVEVISGRSRFARPDGSETYANAQSQKDDSALVKPVTPDGTPAPTPQPTPVKPMSPKVTTVTEVVAVPPAPTTEHPAPEETLNAESSESGDHQPTPSIMDTIAPKGSEVEGYAGLQSWSIGGSGSAAAALPLWLVNGIGATVKRPISDKIIIRYGLDLGYGQTGRGNFFGYGLHGAGLYKMPAKVFDGADYLYGGLEAVMAGLSVGNETSGGYDLTSLFLVGGMGGDTTPGFIGTRLDWTGELRFALQESGSFGVKGSKSGIRSSSSWLLRTQGYVGPRPKEGIHWGGGFDFGSANYNLSNSSSATYNVFSLLLLGRMNL